ncbi:N-6 DNA methylase [Streptosporangium sp. NPDC020072]|uniref:N-6 DNA methylase n=1 Tax=Streptosporangium sp. NPDC020072 TaxID=3154788 RepID=UPI003419A1FC
MADILHGTAREPFDFVAGLLVLKRACDQPGFLQIPDLNPWPSLTSSKDLGLKVSKAFYMLEEMNKEIFQNSLQSIDCSRIGDSALRKAIQELDELSFADEALEFPDTLGTAFDAYLGRYAERHSKGSSAFYTPPSVVELMVRLVEPDEGDSIHDPFAGAGSMLIRAHKFAEEKKSSKTNLRLFGQDSNYSACALARLNLLLHGITDAEIRQGDSLTSPAFIIDGRPQEFDRVLCNPPFSMKYDVESIPYRERMKFGYSTPAHADFMNIQHAMASLRPTGRGAVVAPHGVLFRTGADAAIRRGIIESGRLIAVIGIGANVFYGTALPACILVFSGEGHSRKFTNNDVLFINAEREIVSGRTQNRLEPQNIEMIISLFQERRDIPGFSQLASLDEIAANDYSLSIRRYVDSQTSSSPLLDANALLFGGIPKSEVKSFAPRFLIYGIDFENLFCEKDERYYDFLEEGWEKTAARIFWLGSSRKEALLRECSLWWESIIPRLTSLKSAGKLLRERQSLIADFTATLAPVGVVDRYRLAGVFASWWSIHKDDLRRAEFQADDLGKDLRAALEQRASMELQQLVNLYRSWGERYGTSLADLDSLRETGRVALARRLKSLGFTLP